MPRFRPRSTPVATSCGPPSADDVRRLIADAVRPGHFFIGRDTRLEWHHTDAEDISWEVFRGRLLDPAHTRQRRTFEVWNVYLIVDGARSPEPLLSVKLDAAAGQVHVVRGILSYVHEGYDSGGNVILTREVRKWVRELVGTIDLADFANTDDLLDEIVCRLFQAVVGTSRLPLTSIEAPLPAFTFGQLAYFYRSDAGTEPIRSRRELVECGLHPELTEREKAKWLETVLRSEPGKWVHLVLNLIDQHFGRREASAELLFPLLLTLFNEVSLSPFTDLTGNALLLAGLLSYRGYRPDEHMDFLAHLLCRIGRHLTAYDLVQFHHAGANYPDALLLDAVLRDYLPRMDPPAVMREYLPQLFVDTSAEENSVRRVRFRRRGLRQAWLVRERYRGQLVPDAPTSPGENTRVLPESFARVPEEQILNPHRRTRELFIDDPSGKLLSENVRAVLRQSIIDLQHPHELRNWAWRCISIDRWECSRRRASRTKRHFSLMRHSAARSPGGGLSCSAETNRCCPRMNWRPGASAAGPADFRRAAIRSGMRAATRSGVVGGCPQGGR